MSRTIKLTIAYDGTDFAGMQWQEGQRTVQRELEAGLEKLTGERVRITASGRTDSGVHARGQVVSFSTNSPLAIDIFPRALNATLPHDIAVLDAAEMPERFHAIRATRRKRYRYVLYDSPHHDPFQLRYAWHVRHRLDSGLMHRAAQVWVGTHDFAGLQTRGSPRKTTVRTVYEASVARPHAEEPHVIHFEIEANGFLYNMVRVMIGTLVDVGRGFSDESLPARLLTTCDRDQAGMTAPAQGLFLLRVDYDSPSEGGAIDDQEDEPA